jgi:hypothetical protein
MMMVVIPTSSIDAPLFVHLFLNLIVIASFVMNMLGRILASSGTRPNPNTRPIGSTRPGQNGLRKINPSKPVKIIWAQPVHPTQVADSGA